MKSPRAHGHGRRRHRLLPLAAGCAALLAGAGCHKRRVAAPPVYSSAPPVYPSARAPEPPASRPRERQPDPAHQPPPLPGSVFDPDHLDNGSLGRPVAVESGLASWYGPPYHHHQAADGSIFDQNALTAAHRTLPLGTVARVTNPATGEQVMVRITDRGPFVPGRVLDLSLAAARAIGVYRAGVAPVRIEAFAHPTADPAGHWCVQIGAFADSSDAVQLKNDLLRRYQAAHVIEFAGPTGFWVRINPADPARATSARIAASIHVPEAEPYLVRTD